MPNLQSINFKELFNPVRLNEFDRSLDSINQRLSEADTKVKFFSANLANSISGLDSDFKLFTNNLKSTSSGLNSFNTSFRLFNANLSDAIKLFSSINNHESKAVSKAAQLFNDNNTGGVGGGHKSGDPIDDPELQDLIDLQIRLAIISRFTKNKARLGSALQFGSLISAVPSPTLSGTFVAEGFANDFVSNKFISHQLNKKKQNGKEFNIREELEKAGISPEEISSINWREIASGLYMEQIAKSFPNLKNLSDLYTIFSGAHTFTSGMETATKIDGMVENVGKKINKKKQKDTHVSPIEYEYPSEDIREYDYLNGYSPTLPTKKGAEVLKKRQERKNNYQYKSADVSNFEWELRKAGGQKENGREDKPYSNLASGTSSRAGKSKNGSSKKEEDPVESMVGVFGEVQKVGGAMSTLMQTLNIGADTFVGGIINGFNSALSIIQTMITVMQAVNTIKMFLPFATGGSVPGIGDTDSVPAMLTPGEYVVKKSVVNKFGSGFFEWINGGGLTNSLAGHYNGGGMVAAGAKQMVAVSIPDVKIKGSDLYLSWRRENNTHGRRSI